MMKGRKLIIVLLAILILTSCTFGNENISKDKKDISQKKDIKETSTLEPEKILELIVESFEKKDYTKLKEHYQGDMSDEDLDSHIEGIESILSGNMEDYKRVGIQKSTRIYNGVKTVEQGFSYQVKTSDNDYLINIMMMGSSSDDMKLVGFNVIAAQTEEKDYI